jgi:transposase-like protein
MVSPRRRYSAEEKKAILAEASAPGSTVSKISRRHHITRGLIHN